VRKRILYLQYTNPAAYPPLHHSATLLAEAGWEVLFLGIAAHGTEKLQMPEHPHVQYRQIRRVSGGTLGPLKYAQFIGNSIAAALRFRADWCYASDPLSAPAVNAMRAATQVKLLYHEHDAPTERGSKFWELVLKARAQLARGAEIVVAPAQARLDLIPSGEGKRFVVWNCPRKNEVGPARTSSDQIFRIGYHGSLSRDRLTPRFIDALAMLPPHVQLHIIGYQTIGHAGYVSELQERSERAGVSDRMIFHGSIPHRSDLLAKLREFDLGIATVSPAETDHNLVTLAGASNKAFEYLSAGVPLLVTNRGAWVEMYERPGYGVACDPDDAASIVNAIQQIMQQPDRGRSAGEAGRQRILSEWNYDAQFAPVLSALAGRS
jgi:glycosyltransferase involved in cell wall biosynthesis